MVSWTQTAWIIPCTLEKKPPAAVSIDFSVVSNQLIDDTVDYCSWLMSCPNTVRLLSSHITYITQISGAGLALRGALLAAWTMELLLSAPTVSMHLTGRNQVTDNTLDCRVIQLPSHRAVSVTGQARSTFKSRNNKVSATWMKCCCLLQIHVIRGVHIKIKCWIKAAAWRSSWISFTTCTAFTMRKQILEYSAVSISCATTSMRVCASFHVCTNAFVWPVRPVFFFGPVRISACVCL